MKTSSMNQAFWWLLLICVVTIFPFLGLAEYHTKGEPREAIVSYSMLESGNWTLPRNNGGEMAYKPPFFHWSVAAVSAVFNGGEVTEGSSRLPSALALTGMTLCGFLFFARRKGVGVALVAALVGLTNFELHRAGANCRVDMVLTALTVCALYAFYRWYEQGLRGVPWVAILLMSAGTLTKGPVGTIIPCLVVGVFLLLRGVNFFRAFLLLSLWGVLSLLLPLCWYLAAYAQGGEEFLALVMEENLGRMTSTMSYESCVNPWHYNFVTLFAGYVPWTLLGLLAFFGLNYRRPVALPAVGSWWTNLVQRVRRADPVELFSLTSIVVIFVFYCIPQSKRSVYLMPIYPFIAYYVARFLYYLAAHRPKVLRVYGGILATVALLLTTVFVLVKCGLVPDTIFRGRHAATNVRMLHAIRDIASPLSLLPALLPLLLGLGWWSCKRLYAQGYRVVYAILALTFGLYLALDGTYQPPVLNAKSVKDIAAEIDRVAPASEGTLYEFIEEGIRAAGDPVHYFEINFYLGNRIDNFYAKRPATGFLLVGDRDAEKYLPEFEAEGYRFRRIYTSPRPLLRQTAGIYRFEREE